MYRQAQEIVVDYDSARLVIDGVVFPYLIADDLCVETGSEQEVPAVTITLLPHMVTVVGHPARCDVASHRRTST